MSSTMNLHSEFIGRLEKNDFQYDDCYCLDWLEECPMLELKMDLQIGDFSHEITENISIKVETFFKVNRESHPCIKVITYDNREMWIDVDILDDPWYLLGIIDESKDKENKYSNRYTIIEYDKNGNEINEQVVNSKYTLDIDDQKKLNVDILKNLKNNPLDYVIINNILCGILFKKDMQTIIIPDNVEKIHSMLINGLDNYNESVKEIILPDSITKIDDESFKDIYNLQTFLSNFKYVEKDNLLFLKSKSNERFLLVKPKNLFTDSITITDDTKHICFDFLQDYFIKEIIIESDSFSLDDFYELESAISTKTCSINSIGKDNLKEDLAILSYHDALAILRKVKTVNDIDYVFPKIIYRGNNNDSNYINERIERINVEREKSIGLFKELYFQYQKDVEYISELIKHKFEKDIPYVEFVDESVKIKDALIYSLPSIRKLMDANPNLNKYIMIYGIDSKNKSIKGTIATNSHTINDRFVLSEYELEHFILAEGTYITKYFSMTDELILDSKEYSNLFADVNFNIATIEIEGKQVALLIVTKRDNCVLNDYDDCDF